MLRLRITHKGIALALIPLAVNIVWVLLLSASLRDAQELLEREHRQSVALAHINKLTGLAGKAFGCLASFASSGNDLFREEFLDTSKMAQKQIKLIERLSAGEFETLEFLSKINSTIDEDLMLLNEIRAETTPEDDLRQRVKKLRRLVKQAGTKSDILLQVMQEKQQQLEALRTREQEVESRVKIFVACGLMANFVVALALILLVVADVRRRLGILMNNAHLLPKNLPLTDRVSGNDELSDLDAELHAASAKLIESAEYRRGLMQMMAHDLKSPLTGSMVSLSAFMDQHQGLQEDKRLNSIEKNIKTSVELINDLLLLESLEVGQLALDRGPENLRELVDTAIDTIQSLAEVRQITIENSCERQYICVDRNRILQVITNLLSNAVKFSPAGGTIRVISVAYSNRIEVIVKDQGAGLSPQDCAILFQKFSQTSEGKTVGGTGLGLAISKLIVESHGGEIGVESSPGSGSEFRFTLPVASHESVEGDL